MRVCASVCACARVCTIMIDGGLGAKRSFPKQNERKNSKWKNSFNIFQMAQLQQASRKSNSNAKLDTCLARKRSLGLHPVRNEIKADLWFRHESIRIISAGNPSPSSATLRCGPNSEWSVLLSSEDQDVEVNVAHDDLRSACQPRQCLEPTGGILPNGYLLMGDGDRTEGSFGQSGRIVCRRGFILQVR